MISNLLQWNYGGKKRSIDQEDTVNQTTGITYRMLENACVVLMVPKGTGRSRVPRNLILNGGQFGARTLGFTLSGFTLLSSGGGKTITLPAVSIPFIQTVTSGTSSSSSSTTTTTNIFGTWPHIVLTGVVKYVVLGATVLYVLVLCGIVNAPTLLSILPIPPVVSRTLTTYFGNPLERLGEEAERRLEIATNNIHNALFAVRRKHDEVNHSSRVYSNQLKHYAANVRLRRVDEYGDYYSDGQPTADGFDYGNLDYTGNDAKTYFSKRMGASSHPYQFYQG